MKSQVPPHYRTEDNRTCLDIRLKTAHQLFDGRDPAPFRERDLDEDAVDYIVGAFEEIPAKAPVTIVLWFAEGADASISTSTIREAVHGFFEAEIARIRRRIRQHVKQGQMALGLGLVLLTFFLFLAELSRSLPEGTLREIVREGLVITGWVAMWRPLDLLLYDWWPLVRERRLFERIEQAEIRVEHPGTDSGLVPPVAP